jgi:hypothetical protein
MERFVCSRNDDLGWWAVATKLVALLDRGIDYQDFVALRPTLAQLRAAWAFVEQYEGNPESGEKYWLPLARAVEQALPRDDYRLLGVIVACLEAHHARVNLPRLGRIIAGNKRRQTRSCAHSGRQSASG